LSEREPEHENIGSDPIRWRILAVLLTVIFMSLVSVSIVNVALPSIQAAVDASQSDLQWVLSGYALTFGVILVAAGRAGDIMGRGGIFILGVAIFTAASLAAGLAPDAKWLNAARFVQGVGSGLLNPQGLGMIQQYFRGAERGRAFGLFGTTVGFSVAIGPVLGGFLIQIGGVDLGWRLTFLLNVPIGVLAIVLALVWFPKPLISFKHVHARNRPGQHKPGLASLDPVGSVLLGLAVLFILFPFVEARTAALTWLLLPLGLLLVYVWLRWERYYKCTGRSPMVDLNIFSTRSFSNGALIMTLYFMGMTSIWVLVALYIQEGLGRSALQSGLIVVPPSLASAYAANWAGQRVMRYGRKLIVGGILCALLGLALSVGVIFLHGAALVSVWWLMLTLALIGVGQGTVISPNQTLTLHDVPLDYAGSSGAIMETGQRVGTSVGIAVITAAAFVTFSYTSWPVAVAVGFGLIGFMMLLALWVAIVDLRQRAASA